MPEETIAFLDIGTNSIRLLVVRLNENASLTVLTEQKEVARLGEGVFTSGRLSGEAMNRGVMICRKFVDLSSALGATTCLAVATSATREAENADDFLRELKNQADLDVAVVPGKEEARLIYRGVISGIDIGEDRAFIIDIGGGSTEMIIGTQHDFLTLESMKLGAIRLMNEFSYDDQAGGVSAERYAEMQQYLRTVIIQPLERIRRVPFSHAIGSSGTIQNLAQIASRLHPGTSSGSSLRYEDLKSVMERLATLSLDERRKVPGINPERADIIIGGGVILQSVMAGLGIDYIGISPYGLREGLLMDYLSQIPGFPHAEKTSARRRSVTQLGRSCRIDEKHALTVVGLAARLFDSARDAHLHSFSDSERTLLLYAAYLHDIGNFISFSDHHIHSGYIIRHAELIGFSLDEILMMAEIARYHRKKPPRRRDPIFSQCTPIMQHQIRRLSLLLRMAEQLDRSRMGIVQEASLSQREGGVIILRIRALGDCSLEIWGVTTLAPFIRKVFGSDIVIEVEEGEGDPLRGELPG